MHVLADGSHTGKSQIEHASRLIEDGEALLLNERQDDTHKRSKVIAAANGMDSMDSHLVPNGHVLA